MRTTVTFAVLMAACCAVATAELRQVEVGGSLRIRGNYFNMDSLGDYSFIEQRTRLNVKADFTDDVSAFIEMDSYDVWGEDFRSVYLIGADGRAVSGDDVEIYQAYIAVRNLWGTPLMARVGRQELVLGSEWFVGNNDSGPLFTGLSFDAILLSYQTEQFALSAVAAKPFEAYGDFMENDADLYGVYFSYLGVEDITLDAYWLYARDRVAAMGDQVDLHVLGLRGAGTAGAFDFELEAAYQLGSVDGIANPWFRFFDREADVDFGEFGANMELGYTFDAVWQPRLFARFAFLGGGDPDRCWWSNDLDMPFIRLTTDMQYSEFLENPLWSPWRTSLSNILFYSLGAEATPTESLHLKLAGAYFEADEEAPDARVLFRRERAGESLGWEVGLYATYRYSDDLAVRAGYARFFGKRGLERTGLLAHGQAPWGGDRNDDYDYLFVESEVAF